MTTNSPVPWLPTEQQRPTARLDFSDWSLRELGESPVEHMRLQLRGCYRINYLTRFVTLFAIQDIREARRPQHWRDIEYAIRGLRARRGLKSPRIGDDRFWGYLEPAIAAGVLTCTWDSGWPST